MERFEPHRYPWLDEPGADDPPPPEPHGRTLVVAVGSNASLAVLRDKYAQGRLAPAPRTPSMGCTVTGLAVGHSAHVSLRGYIAAAPFRQVETASALTATWPDEQQLRIIDESEPNYRRVRLARRDYPLVLASGERPEHFDVYVSRHGVLADPRSGERRTLGTQAELFRWLAEVTGDAAFAGAPERICERLGAAAEQRRLKRLFVERGLRVGDALTDQLQLRAP